MVVIKPVANQTTSSKPGLPTCRAMPAEKMKMPEPIIEPATIMLASGRPRLLTSPESTAGAATIGGWISSGMDGDPHALEIIARRIAARGVPMEEKEAESPGL